MAMDALKNLSTNIPPWLVRLDELSTTVDKRQSELAALAAQQDPKTAETKSLRNKGSQESLKPNDDGPSNIPDQDIELLQPVDAPMVDDPDPPASPTQEGSRRTSIPGPGGLAPPNRARDSLAAQNSRARGQIRKRQRSISVISTEGAVPANRTRSMIIVWYDSYVQNFFDDMVRFISSSRNLMRKAKMAAKVAQIKKMAEMEMPKEDGSDKDGPDPLPSLKYMSSRRFGPMGAASRLGGGMMGASDKPDAYDSLDKGLEFIQSACERGAHQFLRDADCHDEVRNIQQKLREVLEMSDKETQRVIREEPELAKETGELGKIRTCRPISIRRELSTTPRREGFGSQREKSDKSVATKPSFKSSIIEPSKMEVSKPGVLEVDADEGIEADEPLDMSKINFRSTRNMRSRV